MKIEDKFVTIIENGYINELCSQLGGNIDFATLGGKIWWNEISSCNEWKLQQNKISKLLRILNPDDIRKAWGAEKSITEAINHIFERIQCNEFAKQQSTVEENDITEKLRNLKKLNDEGLINDEDYKKKKDKILDRF